jgi:hypothetical protein
MGGQRVEIGVEAIAGEEGQTPRSQELPEAVEKPLRHEVRSWSQEEYRNAFGQGIEGYPQKDGLACGSRLRVRTSSNCTCGISR